VGGNQPASAKNKSGGVTAGVEVRFAETTPENAQMDLL